MNIYVIYKFSDYKIAAQTVSDLRTAIGEKGNIFMFEPNRSKKLWHYYAAKKIKESHLVILFDSLSGDAPIGKHISWELKKAEKLKKRIIVFKTDSASNNRSWYVYDYSEQAPQHPRYETFPVNEAIEFIKREYSWQIEDTLLHLTSKNSLTDFEKQLLIEQYRIMIETSEKLMERRQNTVNLYTTLCTTLLAVISASFAFDNFIICTIVLLLSGIAMIILCHNWKISLNSYDLSNTGKFNVINCLEKYLPAEIFESEYRYNTLNGLRSFKSREKGLPYVFSLLGIVFIVIAISLLLLGVFKNEWV